MLRDRMRRKYMRKSKNRGLHWAGVSTGRCGHWAGMIPELQAEAKVFITSSRPA